MASVSQQASNGTRQQAETERVAHATTEMLSTAHEVQGHGADRANAATSAQSSAKRGQSVLAPQAEISRLAADVEQAAAVIHELEQDSEAHRGVLDVIRGVAEQTNLLALNAAIEGSAPPANRAADSRVVAGGAQSGKPAPRSR